MMGYAFGREDLAKGPETDRLRTGDLAQRSGDLYRIVGRRSRFCKPFGLRISLDELEAALARKGIMAAVTGNDDVIAIACRRSEEHTYEHQSIMRISYDVFCLKKKTRNK